MNDFDIMKKNIVKMKGDDLIRAWRKFMSKYSPPWLRGSPPDQWYKGLDTELKMKLCNELASNPDLSVYGKEKD